MRHGERGCGLSVANLMEVWCTPGRAETCTRLPEEGKFAHTARGQHHPAEPGSVSARTTSPCLIAHRACAHPRRAGRSGMRSSGSRGDGDMPASAVAGPSVAAVDPPLPGKAKAMSVSLHSQNEHNLERELQRRECCRGKFQIRTVPAQSGGVCG